MNFLKHLWSYTLKENNTQYKELYKILLNSGSSISLPDMYVKEKEKREEIEVHYNILVALIKDEGCLNISQQIKDELESQERLH